MQYSFLLSVSGDQLTRRGQSMEPTIKHRDPLIVNISVREFVGDGIGESSELSGDWANVDCRLCQKRKKKLTRSSAAEERAIIEQMGDMAAFMRAQG